jgi:hypothetical protein
MIYKATPVLLFALIQLACGSTTNDSIKTKHIFYLHGRIVEEQGRRAYSDRFGAYEFDSIVSAIKVEKAIVHHEIRTENVDPIEYAIQVSKRIDSLINSSVKPSDITVIGASKGAIIAANISSLNTNPINYVLLAGNNNYQESHNDWAFHGQVLCIYDPSDEIAGRNYNYWKARENFTSKFEQLSIATNLGHGFLYKPLDSWILPTRQWISAQN